MKNIFKKIYIIFTTLILLIFIIGSIYGIIIFNKAKDASLFIKQNIEPIYIYDNKNNLISSDGLYYEYCPITQINDNIKNAFIAVEDRNFYKHNGISFKRITSSLLKNILANKITQGASTITQQYIKNAYLSNEQTYKRKITEITYALNLEKKYTKNQILEAYLNTILFGSNIYGIKSACKYYFNKTPQEITIAESAMLAGIIQLPNYYNPFRNPDETNTRKNLVLKCMLEENYITNTEYNNAINEHISKLVSKGFQNIKSNYLTPYLDYLFNNLPNNNDTINSIKTHLDINIQKELYQILSNEYKLFNDDDLNCAIVVLDNKTYGIKALAQNRSFNQRIINYATEVKLQPASTIKPLLDYAPAIEYLNYNPATILVDEPYTYKDGTAVKNYDNNYLGSITLRKALSDSRNIPAIKLFNEVGHEKAFSFVNKLGLETPKNIYESEAIGAGSYTLFSLTNAYLAFANLGYYKKASPIKEINYQLSTYQNDTQAKLVMKPSTAFLINTILHDVFKGSSFDQKNTYMMAKTGQTNYDKQTQNKYNIPSSATKDSLLIAYTKDMTIGIWVGYEKIKENQYLDYYKKNIPRTIMKLLMDNYALDNQYYEVIDDVTKSYITIYNNKAYKAKNNGYYEYFQTGLEPLSYPPYYDSV